MVIGSTPSTDLGKAFEYADHTLPILSKERTSLFHHLLVVQAPGKRGGNNYP